MISLPFFHPMDKMRISVIGGIILAGAFFPVLQAQQAGVLTTGGSIENFHRNQAVLGRWLSGGLWLEPMPEFLKSADFPANPRPNAREVPYADHLSVVRLLGGWNYESSGGELDGAKEADLAYRNPDGTIGYRWELLAPRLQPYLDNGYTDFTLVLDNVPYDLARDGGLLVSPYGQANPPADLDEWREFIRLLALQVQQVLPPESLASLRFRLGTEMQGETRFNGTESEYQAFYKATAEGLEAAMGAGYRLGPYNQAGARVIAGRPDHLDLLQFVQSDATLPLPAFLSHSLYFIPKLNGDGSFTNTDPYERVSEYITFWNQQNAQHPGAVTIPREFHEFGILKTESGLDTNEPGARGAAQTAVAISLLMKYGVEKIWHWQTLENIKVASRERLFPSGLSWLLTLFDAMDGDTSLFLEWPVPDTDGVRKAGIGSIRDDVAMFLVATFHEDREAVFPNGNLVRVEIPKSQLPDPARARVRYVELNSANAVYDIAYDWLRAENLLKPGYEATTGRFTASITQMGLWEARNYLLDRYEPLMKAYLESLSFVEFPGTVIDRGDAWEFQWRQPVPAVGVVVIDEVGKLDDISAWELERLPASAGDPGKGPLNLILGFEPGDGQWSFSPSLFTLDLNPSSWVVRWELETSSDLSQWDVVDSGSSIDFAPGIGIAPIVEAPIAGQTRFFARLGVHRPGKFLSTLVQ